MEQLKIIVFQSIPKHKTIVFVTDTFSKIASTPSQIPYNFVQISPAYGSNTYQIMYGETSDVSVSNGNIKMSGRKINFCIKFAIKLFCATIANTETKSLKSLHTLFNTYSDHTPVKFESNCIVQNVLNFRLFDKKQVC